MTVTAVQPFANTHGGVDAEGVRTYTNIYDVYTDDKDDGSLTARGNQAIAMGLPAYGNSWVWYNDSDSDAICKTRSADLAAVDEDQPYYRKWKVAIGYTTKLQKRDPSSEQGDPQDEPWKVSASYSTGSKSVSRDKDNKAVTNSVDQEIITEIPTGIPVLVLEGITPNLSLDTWASAVPLTNANAMWGLGPRRWLLLQWSWDVGWKDRTPYIRHHFEWHVSDADKWNLIAIDHGTRILVNAAETDPNLRYKPTTARDITLPDGVHLDGAGQPLDIVANPFGFPIVKELIPEYDFLGNLAFLPNPLPGPFI